MGTVFAQKSKCETRPMKREESQKRKKQLEAGVQY
jgi:hypothetical protein